MNNSWTKLYSDIIKSSIWNEDDKTRVLWITMLAMCDERGEVGSSVASLAVMARVSKDDCERSLKILMSPDKDSRNKADDGVRIKEIDRGWLVVNYREHRERARHVERRGYLAEKQAEYRARKKAPVNGHAAAAYKRKRMEEICCDQLRADINAGMPEPSVCPHCNTPRPWLPKEAQ